MQLNFLENRLKIGRRPKVGSFIYSIEFCWKMSLKSAEEVFFVFNVKISKLIGGRFYICN